MATGERVVSQASVNVQLTDEQVAGLGLPPNAYWIHGVLRDDTGTPVELPAVEELWVPTRWLHPVDVARPPTHRDLRPQQPW